MKNQPFFPLAIIFAITSTFSCSSDDDRGEVSSSSAGTDNSSSSVCLPNDNSRIVWGTGVGLREQSIIAGKRTPIYVANASWADENHPTSFDYDDENAGNTCYTIIVTGGNGLKIYGSETGNEQKTSGTIPANGIDTLWVEGGYEIGNQEFTLKANDKEPALKLNVYQPMLRFTESDGAPIVSPSGWARWSTDGKVPYASIGLPISIVAWDTLRGELCIHCGFILDETSTTNNAAINNIRGEGIVRMINSRIENGKLTTYITGQGEAIMSDYAEWTISGPSPDVTNAKWTGLQFKLTPVPMPVTSYIYDRNGDGIGDSMTVEFSKSFRGDSGNDIRDSLLPVLLEVIWEKGDTVRFHAPEFNVSQLKDREWVRQQYALSGFRTTNGNYWRKYMKGDSLSVLVFADAVFSRNIATSGKGVVSSYTPFYDEGVFQYSTEGAKAPVYALYLWKSSK
jgi:hypothetical protein